MSKSDLTHSFLSMPSTTTEIAAGHARETTLAIGIALESRAPAEASALPVGAL